MAHDHDVAETALARPIVRTTRPSGGAGPVTLSSRAASPASLLRLQRLAGNGAVQRVVAVDEITTSAAAPAAAAPAAAAAAPAAATAGGGANTLGDGTGPVSINGPTVGIHAPMVQADGVFQASTIIADSVVASNYTPGAGNVW
jgi:hypothetical protein